MSRVLVLAFSLALGSGLAALARDLPDPVSSFSRAVERQRKHSFEMRGPILWIVEPVQPSGDSVYINGAGYVQPRPVC